MVGVAIGRDGLTAPWDQKFLRSTRGRIITLLRRSRCTVEEVARELGFTDSGVRVHFATLNRDGIVRQRGSVRRGSGRGKPAYVYQLTSKAEAEGLFTKAIEPVLCRLLDVLSERLDPRNRKPC
jgi:predicted ArsR family transcriptional regulator